MDLSKVEGLPQGAITQNIVDNIPPLELGLSEELKEDLINKIISSGLIDPTATLEEQREIAEDFYDKIK